MPCNLSYRKLFVYIGHELLEAHCGNIIHPVGNIILFFLFYLIIVKGEHFTIYFNQITSAVCFLFSLFLRVLDRADNQPESRRILVKAMLVPAECVCQRNEVAII